MKIPKQLAGYKFTVPQVVVWGDMDAMSHVNNTNYFRYMETARLNFLGLIFPEFASADMKKLSAGLALAEARCRFKVSLTYPDEVIVGAAVRDICDSSFVVQHEIYSSKLDCIAAEGDARMVYFDSINNRKGIIPQDLRSKLKAYTLAGTG